MMMNIMDTNKLGLNKNWVIVQCDNMGSYDN